MKKYLSKLCRLAQIIILIIFATLIMISKTAMSQESTTIRPIEDFIYQQGTYCIDDEAGGCILFVPPIENFLGTSDPTACLLASIDYAGLADDWLVDKGFDLLGTEFKGTVIERPLADGRAEVHVKLHTSNALAWVVNDPSPMTYDFNGPLLFGHRAPEVLGGAIPGLADSSMNVVFINTEPGADLPDLIQLFYFPEPGQEVRFFSFTVTANGPLRALFGVKDGAPGKVQVIQTGIFMTPFMGAVEDGFPAEKIKIMKVGK
jgi:hypothetical protein